MKIIRLFAICFFLIVSSIVIKSQDLNYTPLTQEDYLNYFPSSINGAFSYNTNEIVTILPSNEPDNKLQNEINEILRPHFENYFNKHDIYRKTRVITDKEALIKDLSHCNIITVGTIQGNLWTKQFLEKATDFPLKIYNDSIVSDTNYGLKNSILMATWVNPKNKKLPIQLLIPQDYSLLKKETYPEIIGKGICSFSIWNENNEQEYQGWYQMYDGKWGKTGKNVRKLVERDNKMAFTTHKLTPEIATFIHRYPKLKELNECVIDNEDLSYSTISYKAVDSNFEVGDDLEWLKPITKDYNIIALGEEHYRTYNGILFERIFFAANTYNYFPLLVMEMAWSHGAFYNHYLQIKNDKKAEAYYNEIVKNLPHQSFLKTIRSWNKQNPKKNIKVGYSDIEHNFKLTIDFILSPYLQKVAPNKMSKLNYNKDYDAYLTIATEIISEAKKKNIQGEYSFQTPDYYYSVLENLKQSIPIKNDPKKQNDHTERFKAMIRIMTDDIFLGKEVNNGKAFLFGGREHFRTIFTEQDSLAIASQMDFWKGNSFFTKNIDKHTKTEGFYLANHHTPTKGKVYSIGMFTLASYIEDTVLRIHPNLNFKHEQRLIDLYNEGKLELNEPVIGWSADHIHQFIYKKSYEYPNKAFYVNEIREEQIADKIIPRNRLLIKDLGLFNDYNSCIFIPQSPIGPKMDFNREEYFATQSKKDLVHQGQVNLDNKTWDKALEFFDKALAMDSSLYYAIHQKTRILLLLGKFDEAYMLSQRLNNRSNMLKGQCADVVGKRNEAIDYYCKIIEGKGMPTHTNAAKVLVKKPYCINKTVVNDSIYNDTLINKSKWSVEVSSNGFEKNNCIDNNYNKRWTNKQSQRPGEYLIVDLGEIRVLNRIVLIDDALGNSVYRLSHPNKYSISISTNKTNWQTVANGEGSILQQAAAVFDPHEARYIKVTQDGTTMGEWWSVYEIDAYEPIIK